MQKTNKTASLVSIDVLRAIAALGVYYYHLHLGALLSKYAGIGWLKETDQFGALYAVPLFFLISGYCIHLSNLNFIKNDQPLPLREYFKRRFFRIYPAYLFAVLISLLVNVLTRYNPAITVNDVIAHVFLLQGYSVPFFNTINVVLWTISIEMTFYIIYPLFYYLRWKKSLNFALLCVFILSVFSISVFSKGGPISLPARYFVLNLWFAWCCGAFIADKQRLPTEGFNSKSYIFIYFLIVLFFALTKLYQEQTLAIISYQFNILIWTGPLIWVVNREQWFLKRDSRFLRVLVAVGVSSYSLYLLHAPLIDLKNFIAHQFSSKSMQLIVVVAGIPVIPFLAWINYLYIEKPFFFKVKSSADGR